MEGECNKYWGNLKLYNRMNGMKEKCVSGGEETEKNQWKSLESDEGSRKTQKTC